MNLEEETSDNVSLIDREKEKEADKHCLICNSKIVNRTHLTRKKKRALDILTRPFAIILCKALNVSSASFSNRFLKSPMCCTCIRKVQSIKHIVFALETLQKTVKQFRLQVIESLEVSYNDEAQEQILPEVLSTMESAQNVLRKELLDLLSGWKEKYKKTQSKGSDGAWKISLDRIKPLKTIGLRVSRMNDVFSCPLPEPESEEDQLAEVEDIKVDTSNSLLSSIEIEPDWKEEQCQVIKDELEDSDNAFEADIGDEVDVAYKVLVESENSCDPDYEEDNDIAPADQNITSSKRKRDKNRKACLLCKSTFKSQFDLDIHTRKSHLGMKQPFKCAEEGCNRSFRQRYLWKKHLEEHRTGVDQLKRFSCDICSKLYETRNSLARHRSTHTGKWKFPCTSCEKGFHRPSDLKGHEAKEHGADNPYPCKFCKAKFPTNKSRNFHVSSVHPKEKSATNLTCEICSKVFSGKDALRCHQLQLHSSNTEALQYICNACGKGFAKKSWMERHALQHSTEKKYACDQCDEKFRFPNSLACHKLKHQNLFPHKCKHCDKAFRLRTQCNTHELTHRKDKPYLCELCGRSFGIPIYLKNHLKRIHFEELGLDHPPKYIQSRPRDSEKRQKNKAKRRKVELEGAQDVERNYMIAELPEEDEMEDEEDENLKGEKIEVLYEEQIETLEEVVVDSHSVQVLQLGTLTLEKGDGGDQYIQVFVSNQ